MSYYKLSTKKLLKFLCGRLFDLNFYIYSFNNIDKSLGPIFVNILLLHAYNY